MKVLVSLLLLASYVVPPQSTTVYICNSPDAKKYHLSQSCRGLNNCQHKIIKMSQADAEKSGKTLCGWEK